MPDLIVHSQAPYNAEPTLSRLRASFITPQSKFYIRSHGEIPRLSEDEFRLSLQGRVARALELSLDDLRRQFPRREVVAVLQCAGNRRADLHQVRHVTGDRWAGGAIGTAIWSGVALADVLHAVGAATDPGLHVAFEAHDQEPEGQRFGVSIPMAKALCPDVLLAFQMNGETLTPEHGFPLRALVPGFAGVRSPKWLSGITVQDAASDNPVQQSDYKLLPPDVTPDTVDWSKGMTINEMPLNAAICDPPPDAELPTGPLAVRGYATASGRRVARVDVSAEGGRHWMQATMEQRPDLPWAWTFWQTTLDLPEGRYELVVRAWDSAGQTQPSMLEDVWNFKGYLSAAWHRVRIRVG